MQKNDPTIFSEKELDNLLNRLFLESHLAKPEHQKITEVLATHALKAKPADLLPQQSWISKLINSIGLPPLFFIMSIVLAGGVLRAILLSSNPEDLRINRKMPAGAHEQAVKSNEEPIKIKAVPSIAYEQKTEGAENNKNVRKKITRYQSSSDVIYTSMYSVRNNLNKPIVNPDSLDIKLALHRPEPVYFEDTMTLSKAKDSIHSDSKKIETKKPVSKKKKMKMRKKSITKETNKNKTERDRSGKAYNF